MLYPEITTSFPSSLTFWLVALTSIVFTSFLTSLAFSSAFSSTFLASFLASSFTSLASFFAVSAFSLASSLASVIFSEAFSSVFLPASSALATFSFPSSRTFSILVGSLTSLTASVTSANTGLAVDNSITPASDSDVNFLFILIFLLKYKLTLLYII